MSLVLTEFWFFWSSSFRVLASIKIAPGVWKVQCVPQVADDGETDGVAGAFQHLHGLRVGDPQERHAVDLGDLVVAHDAAALVRHAPLDQAFDEDAAEVLCKVT